MAQPVVAVVGLRALMRDIQKMTDDRGPLNKAMTQAGVTAADPVAAATRSAMAGDTTEARKPPHLTGNIRVGRSRSGASVRMGSASVRWAGWVEFGGNRRAPHLSSRPYDPKGRYLFPSAVQLASRSARLYSEAVTEVFANYSWTNHSLDPGGVHD